MTAIKSIICGLVAFLFVLPAWADGGVLVFGGTGQLGSYIVKQLVNAGEKNITVFVRPSSDRSRLDGLDVKYVVGDALNDGDVEAALKSADFQVVISAMSNPRSIEGASFFADTMKSIVKWSKATGVKRIVFHSSTGAGDSFGVLRKDLPEDSKLRYHDKDVAEQELVASGLEYAVIRGYAMRPEPTTATGTAFLSEDHSVVGAVGRADLAVLTLYCLDGYLCANKILHASTPEP